MGRGFCYGVQWYNYIFRDPYDIPSKIVEISARGLIMENPIDFSLDLLENSTIGVFPDLYSEAWESCQFNPDFLELDRLEEIVMNLTS